MKKRKGQSAQSIIAELLKTYSRPDIASKMSISESTLRRWETEKDMPHKFFLRELKLMLVEE